MPAHAHLFSLLLFISFVPSFVLSDVALDYTALNIMCCACQRENLICPFCKWNDKPVCSNLGSLAQKQWTTFVSNFYIQHFPARPYMSYMSPKLLIPFTYLSAYSVNRALTIPAWTAPCTVKQNPFNYLYGSLVTDRCSYYSEDGMCAPRSGCSSPISSSASGFTFCSAQRYIVSTFWPGDSGTASRQNYCSRVGTAMVAPQLVDFLSSFSDPIDINAIAATSDSFVISGRNTSGVEVLLPLLPHFTSAWRPNPNPINVYCTDDPEVVDVISPYPWGFWSNVAIVRRPVNCPAYIPFNSTFDICASDLILPAGTPHCPDTFRPVQPPPLFSQSFPFPKTSPNITCKPCIDYFFEQFNTSFSLSANFSEFAKLQDEYATQRQDQSRSFWTDWIGGILTAGMFSRLRDLLFEAIDYLLVEFLEIIGDIIINAINTFISLLRNSSAYLNRLIAIITQILDALFLLLSLILKVVIGIVLQAEQHFLVFEYVVLFLLINSKLLNNNIFSLIIVILVMIVFGIDRQSPSVLLYLYNAQYDYVNMSYYRDVEFSYEYQINYHNRKNGSYGTITIIGPNLSISNIPKYDTSSGSITLPPHFPVDPTPISCNQFTKFPLN